MNRRAHGMRIAFAIVPAVFMAVVMVLPALHGLVLSFDCDGPSLRNYARIFHDPMFLRALVDNLIVPILSLAVELAAGLGLALLMTARRPAGAAVEVAAILPFAIPEIVLLTIARYIFLPRGYLNAVIGSLGGHALGWLRPGDPLALLTVIVVDAWHVTPIVMLILMAGLQTIAPELYEAALLDGAGPWATFRHITLPLLAPALAAAVILRGVDALRIFSTTLVLSGPEGVPVLSTYAYQLWSDAQEPHMAMAASVILALLITALGLLGFALARRLRLQELM